MGGGLPPPKRLQYSYTCTVLLLVSEEYVDVVLAQGLLRENIVPFSFAEEDGFYSHLHIASRSPLDEEAGAR